ncbi:MAG: glycogen synthase [Clostridiales bacterium]|jgi:starch synthase|nr:glycogen synthase [Clostridiales bacterium]
MPREESADIKTLIISSEAAPYAKSGGLGDVVGALPKALRRIGVDARIVIPKYKSLPAEYHKDLSYIGTYAISMGPYRANAVALKLDAAVPTYLIENNDYFGRDGFYGYGDDYERFAFFTKAAIELCGAMGFDADVLHFNDWQTGLGPIYLRDQYARFTMYGRMKSLFTIHNLKYQGRFPRETLRRVDLNDGYYTGGQLEFCGTTSYMKGGVLYADAVSAVSRTYADEIQTPAYGQGLDGVLRRRSRDLYGITNGIDDESYDPAADPALFAPFSARDPSGKAENKARLQAYLGLPVRADAPMLSVISRLVDQKGLDILAVCLDELMRMDIQLVILGAGDWNYERMFKDLRGRHGGKVSANIMFSEDLARKIYAGSDIFLMPSLFEPCGLGQMIAMRYGAVPVVRRTGGLNDTVSHWSADNPDGVGFLFNDYVASGLMWAVRCALEAYRSEHWPGIVRNAMRGDFSWTASAQKYAKLYAKIAGKDFSGGKSLDGV